MFEQIFGHHRVKKTLGQMLRGGGLARSLAFVGPDGIGKRMLALDLARVMLCETETGCGTCVACAKCTKGIHPDVEIVEPDGAQIKVDQVRQVAEKLHFRPFEGRVRVTVIDRAETLRDEAANAFLKSLEEPPEYVYFILVTSDWNSLLPTIRSRCQKLTFQALRLEDKIQILESRGLASDLAVKLAAISLRRLETEEEAWQQFEKSVETALVFLERSVAERGVPGMLSAVVRDRANLPDFLDIWLLMVRECCRVAAGIQVEPPFEAWRERIMALAAQVSLSAWQAAWQDSQAQLARRKLNPNMALWFDSFSVNQLNQFERAKSEFLQRVKSH